MRLDILGSNGTFPERGGACAGSLLRHDGYSLWMDAGTGTLAALQEHISTEELGALFLSHMHADHMVDVYPLLYALSFRPGKPAAVPLFAPKGSREYIGRLMSDDARDSFATIFDMHEYEPGDVAEAGPFRLAFFDSKHSARNLTLRAEAAGKVVCYSGDTGPNPWLADAARDADLFLCEASWQEDTEVDFGPIHMKASESGEAARKAGVARLMLTHIWPMLDRERSRSQAAETFGSEVELATKGEGTDV